MSDIKALEQQIAAAKAVQEQRDRMVRLANNPDFRALVIEGFCRDECARYCHVSTDPGVSKEDRADALGAAQAAGHLKRWVNAIIMMGNRAAEDLPQLDEALAEARAESSEG
ncbi:hypothetical protein [Mesorhizobium sp. M7A.F.Ca.CA.002.12.1.1]|uniref:hypothetical protein n=1 Tax=Mesorhizobium sp. M7A.F.Ca.CA.002.12.1.1 TaxID=2496735 RepID=UPI000FC9D9A9|nr:hypothetical protein [Mesorhizobium sp. M7A.F.Ca.CA.002.12.1.1]RUX60162.1 hypothetical protein EN989_11135 [Mesorhizobium sp. M7A.F.Ca.CA.002.12.1.1]